MASAPTAAKAGTRGKADGNDSTKSHPKRAAKGHARVQAGGFDRGGGSYGGGGAASGGSYDGNNNNNNNYAQQQTVTRTESSGDGFNF